MIISPDRNDFSTIFNLLGRFVLVLSGFMLLPLAVALIKKEIAPFYDFTASFFITISLGLLLKIIFPLRKELNLIHAFFTVSLGWMIAAFVAAVPLYFSSHFGCYTDAWFEAMSGFATTGFTLAQDLDHMSFAHNIWRHLTMFIGGQGIILASVSLLMKAQVGAVGFYVGEARQEKILPNVIDTARFIWKASIVYLIVGTAVLTMILYYKGLSWTTALFHAFCLFCAAFDTGGFGPQAQNVTYYHSVALETATVVLMFLGAINFNLHFWLWNKDKKEIFKNVEARVFLLTLFSLVGLFYVSVKNLSAFSLFRKGFYQIASAHTGCGFTNLAFLELNGFSDPGILALIFAMMIGGGVCSTAGGIKLMRVGIIIKTFFMEIKRWMMPMKSVYKERMHHLQDVLVDDEKIKDAYIYFVLFLLLYAGGAVVGIFLGYPPLYALFESTSAAANVGLSVGITCPQMPVLLKIVYVLQMWIGRLEFLSVFVSLGFIFSLFKK